MFGCQFELWLDHWDVLFVVDIIYWSLSRDYTQSEIKRLKKKTQKSGISEITNINSWCIKLYLKKIIYIKYTAFKQKQRQNDDQKNPESNVLNHITETWVQQ